MFSQIAQVFSTHGVVVPGSERIPVYGKPTTSGACDHTGDCSCFGPKFEQASAKLELSRQARDRMSAAGPTTPGVGPNGAGPRKADGTPLDPEEVKQVRELEKRDREVKAHEAAHKASAGGYAKGGAGYEYQTGPDGRQYAVGGHVDIDAGPVPGNPRATLRKAQTVQRAALAPADPSGADRAVAAAAAQMALEAQSELAGGGPEEEGTEGVAGPDGKADSGGMSGSDAAGGARDARQGYDPRLAYSRSPAVTGGVVNVRG